MSDLPDPRYCGGAVWKSPSYMICVVGLTGANPLKMMLMSGPEMPGDVFVEADGTWLYTPEELAARLKEWTYLGKFRDLYYIGCHPKEPACLI